jgi:hypothetical protein
MHTELKMTFIVPALMLDVRSKPRANLFTSSSSSPTICMSGLLLLLHHIHVRNKKDRHIRKKTDVIHNKRLRMVLRNTSSVPVFQQISQMKLHNYGQVALYVSNTLGPFEMLGTVEPATQCDIPEDLKWPKRSLYILHQSSPVPSKSKHFNPTAQKLPSPLPCRCIYKIAKSYY